MSDYSIFLEVNGTKAHGFTAGRVIWRVDALCGVFAPAMLLRFRPKTRLPSAAKLGAECTLWLQIPAGQQKPGVGVIVTHEITGDTDACGGVGSQHQCRFGGLHSPVAGMAEPNSPANRPRAMRALWHQGGGRGGLVRVDLSEVFV